MKKIKFIVLLLSVSFLFSGCSISFKTNGTVNGDGGVFISQDKGSTWRQTAFTSSISGSPDSFSSLDAGSLAVDPEDTNAFYFGSSKGLYYTYNLSDGWNLVTGGLPQAMINAVVVSPDDKCQIYAATANKIYRSDDCSRSWKQVYFNDDTAVTVTSLVIDSYMPSRVYIGTSMGDVLESEDRGQDWRLIASFNSRINRIVLSFFDTRIIFVATNGDGVKRSLDGGNNWEDLKKEEKMSVFNNNFKIVSLATSSFDRNLVYAATNDGLFVSNDNGDSWSALKILTEKKNTPATINDMAINYKNPLEIYYATNTTFYSTIDGGTDWKTVKLPSTRAGWRILIKPDETNVIFLGLRAITS